MRKEWGLEWDEKDDFVSCRQWMNRRERGREILKVHTVNRWYCSWIWCRSFLSLDVWFLISTMNCELQSVSFESKGTLWVPNGCQQEGLNFFRVHLALNSCGGVVEWETGGSKFVSVWVEIARKREGSIYRTLMDLFQDCLPILATDRLFLDLSRLAFGTSKPCMRHSSGAIWPSKSRKTLDQSLWWSRKHALVGSQVPFTESDFEMLENGEKREAEQMGMRGQEESPMMPWKRRYST